MHGPLLHHDRYLHRRCLKMLRLLFCMMDLRLLFLKCSLLEHMKMLLNHRFIGYHRYLLPDRLLLTLPTFKDCLSEPFSYYNQPLLDKHWLWFSELSPYFLFHSLS